jgi:hypothetical protein
MKPIVFKMTEGYSPHVKMSFASELPVGVVALLEPVDIWFEDSLSDSQFEAWSNYMPTGFKLIDFIEIPDGSPSLSKCCSVSEYLINARSPEKMDEVRKSLFNMAENKCVNCIDEGEFVRFTANNNAITLGAIVRELISDNTVEGWHDLRIVRVRVRGE